ncbi:hypothetical protein EDB80DRAFT_596203 [Ilyonectria destructans]|nr:hypothetical protein EDB80DRAFT_596203 [Ilyonectria destructans]
MQREGQEHSCTEDSETTPWLKHTGWPQRFCNRPLDIITASARLPVRGPNTYKEDLVLGRWRGELLRSTAASEARMRVLMHAVDDMFDRAEDTLTCTPYQSRCWLTSYQQGMFRHRPLRVMSAATARGYKSKWKKFICYIFRAFEMSPSLRRDIHNVPLRGDDVQMMRHILNLASDMEEDSQSYSGSDSDSQSESDSENDSDSDYTDDRSDNDSKKDEDRGDRSQDDDDDEVMQSGYVPDLRASQATFRLPQGIRLELSEALLQLSMMFWTYQSQDGAMTCSTIVHFVAVLGIHPSSLAYRNAYDYTPDLAALVWVGRLLFLEYSLPRFSYDTLVYRWPCRAAYPSHPDRLEAIRTKYMLRGCYSPLAELIELKAFGKSIARREGARATLTWAPDGGSFTIGNHKVIRLSEFCTTYRAAIAQVQELVAELMLGWDPVIDLSAIRDDLTWTYKAMARRAWSSTFRGKALAKSGHWLPGPCLAYLEAGAKMSKQGFSAFHITSGLPGRATETTGIRFRNTRLAIRNMCIREGQVMIIISYNKARASTNHAFYVVRYLPDELGISFVTYVAYIRPFLDFLATQLELPHYHSNEFLFSDPRHKRRHMSPSQATEALKELTQTLQTPWTISLYRQAAIAIAKRHIRDLIKKRNCYHPSEGSDPIRVLAAGVGHRPRMLLTGYAIDTALPSRLQAELLEMYRQLSTLWQSWNQEYYNRHCIAKESAESEGISQFVGYEALREEVKGASASCATRDIQSTSEVMTAQLPPGFIYNAEHQILICVACKSAISPGKKPLYSHLNRTHRILGPTCKAYIQRFSTLQLLPLSDIILPREKIPAIPGLRVFIVFRCSVCQHLTSRWDSILDHISTHKLGMRPLLAWERGLISRCYAQTFSAAKGRIVYFEIMAPSLATDSSGSRQHAI